MLEKGAVDSRSADLVCEVFSLVCCFERLPEDASEAWSTDEG